MADTDRIKRNLNKMIDAGAPETDIDAYLKSEGFNSAGEWRAAVSPVPKPVGAAMAVQQPPPQIAPGPRTAQMPDQGMEWSDVAGQALRNLPSSAGNFLTSLAQPFLHPVDTGNALLDVGKGVLSKVRPADMSDPAMVEKERRRGAFAAPSRVRPVPTADEAARRAEIEAPADAVGRFFVDRYGSVEGLKNTMATDPVGFAADVSMPLTLGGSAAARVPGVVGQVGRATERVGAAIDPLTASGNALKATATRVVEPVVSNTLGLTTGGGTESVRAAGRAGREGGEVGASFRANMRGNVPVSDVVDRARSAVEQMRQERSAAYKAGMADVSKDRTVLDFQAIEDALGKANEVGSFKGVNINRPAGKTVDEISAIVQEWKALDPAEFHTPEGIDALKRSIGSIRDSAEYGTPARVAADRVYGALKDQIAAQAPGYAKIMEDYAKSSDKLKEVTKTFSIGEKATGDTAARKLQSAARNNVQTNYGERGRLLDELAKYDETLPYAIAGQSLNAVAPRGLVARGGALLTGGGAAGSVVANPFTALPLLAFSPRFVGEAAHLGGRIVNALTVDPALLRAVEQGAFQGGRIGETRNRALALRSANALRQ
ncbi:MAG TPA: hypothetical protein VM760_07400 [Sphingomicrobium sp.]|jgi:hypothetical protein|nr:hypothetical protein [Sphingomicrobium sp.]